MPKRRKRIVKSLTPVRAAIRPDSSLQPKILDGLQAILASHRVCFDDVVRRSFADSLDLDAALRKGREQENRWDYLLGHKPSNKVVAVEPHSAENHEITTVIDKLHAARDQLREHLCDRKSVSKWLWVASGKVHLAPMENAVFRLAQNGIEFVGRKITNKHLA